ncbi:MAG: hypothetical protein RIC35_18255 [Marinoscillum sp.]
MNPTPQQHQIDAYLRGELNSSELRNFESLMEKDHSFAEQVKFEEKIQQGLAEVRKAELKARLDAVEVSTGWVGGLGQLTSSTLVKTLGGVITASVVGVLVYNNLDFDTVEGSLDSGKPVSEISHPQLTEPIEEIVIPLEDTPEPVTSLENTTAEESRKSKTEVVPAASIKGMSGAKTTKIEETKDFVPQVTVPTPGDLAKEEGLTTPDSEVPEITSSDEINTGEATPVDVETIHRKNESLKYKYFDGKLFLYGDFNDNPYEILEINGVSDRRLFLFYEKAFYSIQITDKVQDLSPISNEKLIGELEIIRNNKL